MQWLTDNWHSLFPYPWGSVSLSILALLCGAWVGIERQRKEKPAGIRTMALIALGSSAFTMVGYAFTSSTGDSGRVAAQIVTGVGFLGGGVLIRGTTSIHGVTTAATIWLVAAMGMAIGAGHAGAGVGLAVMNPNSGPGTAADPNYANAVRSAQASGVRVAGYVYTSYGSRSLSPP